MKKKLIILMLVSLMVCLCMHIQPKISLALDLDLLYSSSSSVLKDNDGVIYEKATFTLNEEQINILGYDIVKNELTTILTNNLQRKYDEYLILIESKKTESLLKNEKKLYDRYNELLEEVVLIKPVFENYNVICTAEFKSTSAYCLFYNITQTLFEKSEEVEEKFITKYYFKTNSNIVLNQGLYSLVLNIIKDKTTINTTNEVATSYSYLARSKRYHSNADKIQTTDEGYLHTWNLNSNQESREIYFYVRIANRDVWFAIAIVASFCLSIILSIIALLITLIKNHKNKKLNNNINN